jgi:hypothetical protein
MLPGDDDKDTGRLASAEQVGAPTNRDKVIAATQGAHQLLRMWAQRADLLQAELLESCCATPVILGERDGVCAPSSALVQNRPLWQCVLSFIRGGTAFLRHHQLWSWDD